VSRVGVSASCHVYISILLGALHGARIVCDAMRCARAGCIRADCLHARGALRCTGCDAGRCAARDAMQCAARGLVAFAGAGGAMLLTMVL